MKVGLYFGSFNPIHHGHLIISQYILNMQMVDSIWFVVTPQNPFKTKNSLLNQYHRKYLIDIAIEYEKRLKTSSVEFGLPIPSYTIDTLVYLKEKYPQNSFEVIMGSDSFQNIEKWKNFQTLVKDYRLLIFPRKGYEIKNHFQANIKILDAPLIEISSTHIRDMIKKGHSIKYLVPDVVKNEIESSGYYK